MIRERVLEPEKMVAGGDALARTDERVWFVRGAWAGEKVRAYATRIRRDFVQADVEEILRPHAARRDAPCRWQSTCGGCAWMPIDEAVQREAKRNILREALARAGCPSVDVPEFESLRAQTGYRTSIECVLSVVGSVPALAFHGSRSHGTVAIDRCLVAAPEVETAFEAVRHGLADLPEDLRRAVVQLDEPWRWTLRRDGLDGGAVIVWRRRGTVPTAESASAGAAEGARRALAERLFATSPAIRGVVDVVTAGETRGGASRRVLCGTGDVRERVGSLVHRFPAESFFQPHVEMVERLREETDRALDGVTGRIWDLYAGVGVFGLSLAGPGRRLVLVEADPGAAAAASATAAGEGLEADVVRGPVAGFLDAVPDAPAAVVLDPPRSGLGIPVAKKLAGSGAARLVWFSCDAATFARDVRVLFDAGYRWSALRAWDAFPQTPHFETVAVLDRPDAG